MDQNETYIIIQGFPKYEVSNMGNVRNVKTGRSLRHINDGSGYNHVTLCNENGPKNFNIHRLIATYFIPNPDNLPCIDHIDNNKQNNTINNLRWCTQKQNTQNVSKRTTNTSSIYKGVSWDKSISKWRVQIRKNGKNKHIGYCDDEKEAARIYNEKAIELFGEFAKLNVIDA